MSDNFYFVICRLDRQDNGEKGQYSLCRTSQPPFGSLADAKKYALEISPSREPIVLKAVLAPHGASSR